MASLDSISVRSRDPGSSSLSSPCSSQAKRNARKQDTCPSFPHTTSNSSALPRKVSAGITDFNNGCNSQNICHHHQQRQHDQPTNVPKRKQRDSAAPDEDHRAAKKTREHVTTLPSSNLGLAVEFVEKVAALSNEQNAPADSSLVVFPLDLNEMVFRTVRLLETQQAFCSAGKPGHVDIGYHYSHSTSLASIESNGLLSKSERKAKGIASRFHGEVYGAGVF